MFDLAVTRRIMITMPAQLLEEVDGFVHAVKGNRSKIIREAMRLYLETEKRRHIHDALKRGYLEMAEVNLQIARESFVLESEAMEMLPRRMVSGVS